MLYRPGYRGLAIRPRLPLVDPGLLRFCCSATLLCASTLFCHSIAAGQITLKNGDALQGEITGINTEAVLWKSDSFGAQRITKTKIETIETSTPLKIPGHDQPCKVTGMLAEYLLYECPDSGETASSLFTLNNVQRFTEYEEGEYLYQGKASVAATLNRGNLNQEDIDLHAQVRFQRGELRHVLEADYERLSVENDDPKQRYKLRYRLDWFLAEQWFWYNESELGRDDNRNVEQYLQLGSGAGYQVWNNVDGKLDLEIGAEYTFDDFHVTDTSLTNPEFESSKERLRMRLGNNFEYTLYGEISVFNRNKLLYSLNDSEDWEFALDTGVNVPFTTDLYTELVVEFDYINQTVGDTEQADTKVTLGIGYQW